MNCAERIVCIEKPEMPNLPENLEQSIDLLLDEVANQYVLKNYYAFFYEFPEIINHCLKWSHNLRRRKFDKSSN